MLNPRTASIIADIVNLFAVYNLPIIARASIFEDVKLEMDSRLVEPVESESSIIKGTSKNPQLGFLEVP